MLFKSLSRHKEKGDAVPSIGMDKTVKSLVTAFYLVAGASGAAMAGLAGVSIIDKDSRAAFEHCVRGANVCTKAEMEDVQRFEARSQWQLSATMLFMAFFPAAGLIRGHEKTAARRAVRDEEKRQEMSDLRRELRKEQRDNRHLQEALGALKTELTPYRAQAEADAQKATQAAALQEEAVRIAAATGLQQNIGISKPVTLKRK